MGPPADDVDAGDVEVADATPTVTDPIVCASVSGTRLQREKIEPVAGATQEYRIMDTVYDAECRYQSEDAGAYTCYPLPGATTTSVYYQDANCTSALARFTAGAETRPFTRYVRPSAMACGATIQEYRVVGVASPVNSGAALFRRNGLGACVPVTAPAGDYYVAGAPLNADDFVGASTEAFSTTTRLSGLVYAGNDGSKMCSSGLRKVDSSLNVSCDNRFGTDAQAYCIPVGGSESDYFSDNLCTSAASAVAVGACQTPNPSYVIEDTSGMCGAITRTVASVLADEITVRYRLAGNNCRLQGEDTNTYFAVGDSVADSEFAMISSATEAIEGRVQRHLLVAADSAAEFTGSWYDTKLETDCVFRSASDGSFRCLPMPMQQKALFTDVGCTSPITLAVEGACGEPVGYMSESGAMGLRIFSAKAYSPAVYELSATICAEYAGTAYEQDFEHASSSFHLGEIVVQ